MRIAPGSSRDVKRASIAKLTMHLRSLGISSHAVLESFETIPRDEFTDRVDTAQAFEDSVLPLDCGQDLPAPSHTARVLEAAKPDRKADVLEIGTGSGFEAALMSKLFRRVSTVERYRTLKEAAAERFKGLRLENIQALHSDGLTGWPHDTRFHRIIVSGSVVKIPETLEKQLAHEGLLLCPVREKPGDPTVLHQVSREGSRYERKALWRVRAKPLEPGIAAAL